MDNDFTKTMVFRVPPDMQEFLKKRAAAARRTLSDYLRLALEDHRRNWEAQEVKRLRKKRAEAAKKRPKLSTLNDYVRLARKEVEAQKRAKP